MNDMQKLGGGNPMMGMGGFEMFNLIVNANHPKVGRSLEAKATTRRRKPSNSASGFVKPRIAERQRTQRLLERSDMI